eukprot:scaffold130188_cov63-Phaeocystis_antarctica.AAC.4
MPALITVMANDERELWQVMLAPYYLLLTAYSYCLLPLPTAYCLLLTAYCLTLAEHRRAADALVDRHALPPPRLHRRRCDAVSEPRPTGPGLGQPAASPGAERSRSGEPAGRRLSRFVVDVGATLFPVIFGPYFADVAVTSGNYISAFLVSFLLAVTIGALEIHCVPGRAGLDPGGSGGPLRRRRAPRRHLALALCAARLQLVAERRAAGGS